MADKKKQLVLVIEGTVALAPSWSTIFLDYLRKLISLFCGSEPTVGSSSTGQNVELALVIFNTHNSYSPCFVQRSSWTRDASLFFDWLSAIHFTGGGFCDAAIAEGLAEALTMFPSPDGKKIQKNEGLQRHCILVAASNPYVSETHSETALSDANTVAKSFPQYGVSLSVICPTQLLKLKAIYNAEPSTESNDNVNILKPVVVSGLQKPVPNNISQSRLTNPTVLPGGTATGVNISQQVEGMQSVEVNNNMPIHVSFSQRTLSALQTGQLKYPKVWEGDLYIKRQGEPVFLTRLEAYRSSSDPASLAEDWPSTMHIEGLATRDHMNNRKYAGKAQCIFFRALNQHGFLGQLQEKKLCTVIKLPSQTLLLTTVTAKACRLIGMLFSGHMEVFRPQISGQKRPPSSRQQQRQQKAGAGTNQGQVSSQGLKA